MHISKKVSKKMASNPSKSADNIYCQCRKQAAKKNPKLNSREGAAELLGLSVSSLSDYELNVTKVVPVDKVALMADLYDAPELCNYYCKNVCPLGDAVPKAEVNGLERITLKALVALNKMEGIQEELLSISEDGVVDENEREDMLRIIDRLNEIASVSQSLKIWAEKNLK